MNLSSKPEILIQQLRSELEGYGTLFRLLEEQRAALIWQDADAILAASQALDEHILILDARKRAREETVRAAGYIDPVEGVPSLGLLIANLSHESRPLLEELFREINRLVKESRRQLQRNQMLFRRAWDLGQQLLQLVNPQQDFTPTYRRDGYSRKATGPVRSAYVKLA